MTEEISAQNASTNKRIKQAAWITLVIIFTFLLGIGSGYLTWGRDETAEAKQKKELTQLYEQVNPKDGYTLPVSYGNLGPQLVESGVIKYDAMAALYQQSGTQ